MTKLILTTALAACSIFADTRVEPARVLKYTNPDKKSLSTAIRSKGTVELELTINERGKIRGIQVLNGRPDLLAAALQTVQRWDFAPAQVEGHAVQARLQVSLQFEFSE